MSGDLLLKGEYTYYYKIFLSLVTKLFISVENVNDVMQIFIFAEILMARCATVIMMLGKG